MSTNGTDSSAPSLDDEKWLELLSGNSSGASPPEAELLVLRNAIIEWQSNEMNGAPAPSDAEVERLLFRLRSEGLLESKRRHTQRHCGGWLAAAASMAVVSIAIGLSVRAPVPDRHESETAEYRGGGLSPNVIQTRNPGAALDRLQSELAKQNIDSGVDRRGVILILRAMIPEDKRSVLTPLFDELHIAPNHAGLLTVEIQQTSDASP